MRLAPALCLVLKFVLDDESNGELNAESFPHDLILPTTMTSISSIIKSTRNIMRQDTGTGSDELRILQLGWMLFLKIFSDKDKELELLQDNYRSPIPAELHWDQWAGDDEGITGDELVKFVDQKLFPILANIDLSSGNKRPCSCAKSSPITTTT